MQVRTVPYPLHPSPVPVYLAVLFVLIGLLAIPVYLPARQRPERARCEHAPGTPVGLQCSLDGGPMRALTKLPVVTTRRQARNTYNDASLLFVDGSATSAEISYDRTASLNRAMAAAAEGGPAFELPLATGRWIAAFIGLVPLGLLLVFGWWRLPRRVDLVLEEGPLGTTRLSTVSTSGQNLCAPITVGPGARVHVERSAAGASVYVDGTPLLPRPSADHPDHERVAMHLASLLPVA